MEYWIKNFFFLLLMGAAVYQDITTGKVKNQLNVAGVILGLVFAAAGLGLRFRDGLAGLGLSAVIGLGLYALSLFRAGDAKLLWIVGAFKGPYHFFNSLIIGIIAGGVMAVVILLVRRDGKRRFRKLQTYLLHVVYTGKYQLYPPDSGDKFPFSVPIAVGAVADLFFQIISWK